MFIKQIKFTFLVVALGSYSILSCAQTKQDIVPQTYVAHKTQETITIDGKADETSWQKAKWTNNFIDIEGIVTPKYKTKVKMLWDETYFYIFTNIEEPHVWADIKKHDAVIFYNNDFEIFVDPDGDTYNYYETEINALNTVWDLFITKPYREENVVLNDYETTGLKSAVQIHGTLNDPNDIDEGWTLEIAIPWDVYKTSYYEDAVPRDRFFRVNFSRVNWNYSLENGKYYRKKDDNGDYLHEYNWVWSPIGVINMHEPEKWGYVYFSTKKIGQTDHFIIPQDEKIKWELFKLYRAQKKYHEINKKWANSIENLTPSAVTIDSEILYPILETHNFGYNISVKSPFTKKMLIINQEGKFKSQ
ncbi:carbohydrate-binding family 9-like protein [Aestuariivivens marinum]|uniref:carbohydrate-binding family 9-like protein n=1 Tax=Aestuariivivens marinum TaxID=2913555 RepID=UPI001F59A337|nr:carbohydrate-binding family 9-like protein [Aestuariivivens marinum]